MLNNLEILSNLPGVSGREEQVREYILEQITPLADKITVDACGSVIALKKGARAPEHRLMISAHMDEVGLIITRIMSNGLLRFDTVGGIDPRVLAGRTVLCGDQRIPGVIGMLPVHLSKGDTKGKCPKAEEMTIDIGADSADEVKKLLAPGDVCVFDTTFEQIGDGMLKGKALDDRAGCAVLIELMKQELPYDTYFVFCTMEEVGLRGAKCAAFTVDPHYALVIEATTAADIAGVDEDHQVCHVGGGAVVGFMDRRTIYDRELYLKALEIGRTKGISVQTKQAVAGGNDAGAIQTTRGGVRTLAISLPCRYLHAPAALISEIDLLAVSELTLEMARELLESK
ncbi:MAG: M42 family metallopeptidase [Ruminococcaceae bacterium]|nr:M42 family metallopeptidase [Oscillospiraceae bacterium]